MPRKVAFVTIGQSPRSDVTPEVLAETRSSFDVVERGALDGLTDAEIAALAPRAGEQRLVSRLKDGREVILGKPAIDARLHAIFAELDTQDFDLIVLICTGHFTSFRLRTPFIEPQHLVDHVVQGLAYGKSRIGVVLPNVKQVEEFHGIPGMEVQVTHASPYAEEGRMERLREAGRELAGTDLIIMHCIGYSEAMRQAVREGSGKPVLVSRQIVAHGIDLVLS